MLTVKDIRRAGKRDQTNQTLTMLFIWFMFGIVVGSLIPWAQDCETPSLQEHSNQIRSN